ncbi:glucan endo-1,3-beta-glucosidase isoform X2 [Zingiber officinale]|uniref:glucan endo-1,3-beta-glucosidase isoform X2 n=1 Tax=Zingiber officinale TaxID=94328 RepID=UPI001C4D8E79|nr:glucan endo-1,3-beta-glucosidase isoform X2 [Zingiber officinale]
MNKQQCVSLTEIIHISSSAMATRKAFFVILIALLISILVAVPTRAQSIGVCYGMLGNNLPQPTAVVNLYRSNGIGRMRLYDPNQTALRALRNSNIQLIMDVPRTELQSLASNPSAAANWVQANVVAFWPSVSFRYIAVGNELIPGDAAAQYVLPAMRNVQTALSSAGLQIKVSTAVDTGVLGQSFPPSNGAFSAAAQAYLAPILQFLRGNNAPLLVNVYPYFSYADNPSQISLAYALFTAGGVVVQDGQFGYQNLFDAQVDAVYAALEKAGAGSVVVVVSESGWPSAGGFAASVNNARTYNQNLIRHVGRGTPRRAGRAIEAYLFAMFNENQKSPGVEQNFGLFYPNGQPVYPISFSQGAIDEVDGLADVRSVY